MVLKKCKLIKINNIILQFFFSYTNFLRKYMDILYYLHVGYLTIALKDYLFKKKTLLNNNNNQSDTQTHNKHFYYTKWYLIPICTYATIF